MVECLNDSSAYSLRARTKREVVADLAVMLANVLARRFAFIPEDAWALLGLPSSDTGKSGSA